MPEVPVSLSWQALSRQARFLYALIISTLSNCRPNSGKEFCSELRHEEIQWSEVMSLLPCLSLHRQYWSVLTGVNSAIVQVKCQNSMHKIRAICKSDHSCSMKIKIERCISIDQYSAKYMLLISRPPWVDYIVVAAALLLWLCHLNN